MNGKKEINNTMKLTEQKLRQAVRQYINQLITEQEEEIEVEDEIGGLEQMPTDDDEILSKFPKLKEALKSLMGKDYKAFISDIKYVAPKPTTFQIDLGDEHFNLMWAGNKMGFVCEVQGKKYYLTYLNEKQQAIKAINRLLRLGATSPDESEAEEGNTSDTMDDIPVPAGEETPEEGGVSPDELA
tara:strand:- start:106 stop:660 length:555 start_codon:yes stop_codon:yes gene_type:complete